MHKMLSLYHFTSKGNNSQQASTMKICIINFIIDDKTDVIGQLLSLYYFIKSAITVSKPSYE